MVWLRRVLVGSAALLLVLVILMVLGVGNIFFTGLGAVATLVLAAVAALQDLIRQDLLRPSLRVTIDMSPPDCHKTVVRFPNRSDGIDCYRFMMRVHNDGNQQARDVEVYLERVMQREQDGEYRPLPHFFPVNLTWSHSLGRNLTLPPGTWRHCSLGHMLDPKVREHISGESYPLAKLPVGTPVFAFEVTDRSLGGCHMLTPGEYLACLSICPANAKASQVKLGIQIERQWYADEGEMLGRGVRIAVGPAEDAARGSFDAQQASGRPDGPSGLASGGCKDLQKDMET